MQRIIFMGTPDFAVPALEKIAKAGYEIVAVYTQPDRPAGRGQRLSESPVKMRANELGLRVLTPKTLRAPEAIEELRSFVPEALIVAAYGKLLPQAVLDIAPKGALNIHPSLLPKYRGPSPIPGAILHGDGETGVTIMLLDAGMDTGPILSQVREKISDDDTAGTLGDRLKNIGADLLVETLNKRFANEVTPLPQDEALATITKLVEKEEGKIDWSQTAREIWLKTRAFSPWPGTFTTWRGAVLKIAQVKPIAGKSGEPGTISLVEASQGKGKQLVIAAGDGLLQIERLQPEGKRAMTAQEFLAGRGDLVGERLPS